MKKVITLLALMLGLTVVGCERQTDTGIGTEPGGHDYPQGRTPTLEEQPGQGKPDEPAPGVGAGDDLGTTAPRTDDWRTGDTPGATGTDDTMGPGGMGTDDTMPPGGMGTDDTRMAPEGETGTGEPSGNVYDVPGALDDAEDEVPPRMDPPRYGDDEGTTGRW